MRRSFRWAAALSATLLSPAASADELTLDDLARGRSRAAGVVTACRTLPTGCADEEPRAVLARAFYTLILHDLVYGKPLDDEQIANLALLDPALHATLGHPAALGQPPAAWVVKLTAPSPTAAPQIAPPTVASAPPVADTEPEIEPEPDLAAAVIALAEGDPLAASRILVPLADGDSDALHALAVASERLNLPATALVLRTRWVRSVGASDPRLASATLDAVRLAVVSGSRQPLVELAEILHPGAWHPSVHPDGWLARGLSWQAGGELSPALKAFSEVPAASAPYARGEYQTGVIYLQTGQPWEAIAAFRNAWEAEAEDIDGERVREMALWRMARLYQELQRPQEALALYEVLAITASPLSERAAHRCAAVAHDLGDATLARRWLAKELPRGVFEGEDALLRARISLLAGNRAEAERHLDRAEPSLRALDVELGTLVADLGGLWAALHAPDRNPVLAARLDADPELSAYRAHLGALRADRRALATHPDVAWRAEVGRALDRALLAEERAVRSQATAASFAAVVAIRRDLGELRREASRIRRQLDG